MRNFKAGFHMIATIAEKQSSAIAAIIVIISKPVLSYASLLNKKTLSSVESRLLGDETRWVLLSKAPVLLYYFFVWNTPPGKRVLHVIMYILKKKNCKERQAAHLSLKPVWNIWKPSTYWYWFIEEYSFRDSTLEKLTDDFIGIRGPWLCQHKYT